MILETLLSSYVCIHLTKYLEKQTKTAWFKFYLFFKK